MKFGFKSAVAAIAASCALLTAGCSGGSGEDSAESQGSHERVAALGLGDADTLLALGLTPVTVAPWGTEGDIDPSGVGPWSKDLLEGAQPTPIYNTAQGFTSEMLEKIAGTKPMKIVAVNQAVEPSAKEELEKIAPTTIKPDEYKNWQIPWDVQVTTIAGAVDKSDEGDKLIEKTKQAFQDFRESHPDLQGKTAAAVMPYDGKIGLYTTGDGRGQFIADLGFEIPKKLEGDGDEFFRDISPENYAELNGVDYLFVLDYNGAVEQLKNDPVFQNLDVVREGKVRYLDTDTANAMSMPNPVTIPWAIDKFEAAVKASS
ncbi:iron siderophore-binding protein [Corynebacterium atypicum]|uniref:Iron siderophore-binding protein n=1 Tax=Corynebacterium atypicum TaxID=191610 RepID=A0ABM5QLQ7_9CORY|nr:iron-siderophore ABC transporter substrate-binding protein [Corynebacterium atypicum]AIG63663.1 iron siderophore-binding protein [Corynebacterium atypicum]